MTLHLIDLASYQEGIDLEVVKGAGFDAVNIKTSEGDGYVWQAAPTYADRARELGLGICTFHWLDSSASGADQARIAFRHMRNLGGPDGMAHQCDCEDDASEAIWRDYMTAMQDLMGRPIINYTGDWWWEPRGWNGASLTPYLWAAPNSGYPGYYPGDDSDAWYAGYGGWTDYAALQYAVAPIPGAGGGNVSQTAIRDPAVWAALTGLDQDGDDMDAVQDYRLKIMFENWDPSRAQWIEAGGDAEVWDAANARGTARNGLKQAMVDVQDRIGALQVAATADETRSKATLAAIQALTSGGTSVDTAAIINAINAATQTESSHAQTLTAALAAAQAEVTDLRARLATALQP